MSCAPLVPLWFLLAVALAAVAALAVAYRRPSWPALLRLAAVAMLALFLANPLRPDGETQHRPPRLALVLDSSASMAVREGAATRLERGAAALRAVAAAAGPRWAGERWHLADALSPGEAASATGGTSFDGLARFAGDADGGVAAVVLASDGGDRGELPPENALAAGRVPVFCLALGERSPCANAWLRLETPGPSAFPGQDLSLTVVVGATGSCLGRQSELTVLDEAGSVLHHATLTLAGESRIAVAAQAGAQPGERRWTAQLAAIPGEATTADNTAAAAMRIVDQPLRVLSVLGQPYWDSGFAVRAWRRDRQLQVATVHRIGRQRLRSGEAAPERIDAAALARFDLVAIDTRSEELLDEAAQHQLAAWVDKGGGLIIIGVGDGFSGPLAGLDPLLRRRERREGVPLTIAAAGRRWALAVEGRPTVTAGLVTGSRPFSDLLAGDERLPLATLRHHGAGRVVAVNAEGLWRWSLADDHQGEAAARFWRQLAKAAARDADLGLACDRPRYRVGQEAVISAQGPDAMTVTRPDGATRQLTPSQGEARLAIDGAGLWTLSRGGERLTLVAEADVREVVDTQRRDDRLLRLAQATGGGVWEADQAAELGARLQRRADLLAEAAPPRPWITTPWWVLVLTGLLGGEWWLRRRRHGVV